MPDYYVQIGERQYHVSITDEELLIDGEPISDQFIPLNEDGLHLLRQELKSLELHLHPQDPGTYEILVDGQRVIAQVESKRQQKRRKKGIQKNEGTLTAPMPGLVVDVMVEIEEKVEKGQALVIFESMKMQMHLRVPIPGRVKAIHAKPGDQVEKGAILVEII